MKDSIKKVMLTNVLRKKYETIITNEKTIVDSIIAKTASRWNAKNGTNNQCIFFESS